MNPEVERLYSDLSGSIEREPDNTTWTSFSSRSLKDVELAKQILDHAYSTVSFELIYSPFGGYIHIEATRNWNKQS
jgi:hypothetical protein